MRDFFIPDFTLFHPGYAGWAEWIVSSGSGHAWDDAPREKLYEGAEPVEDTVILVERCLAYLRQTTIGSGMLERLR